MSGPYSQEQYERAKTAVTSGGIPPEKVPVVQSRIAQYEDDRARGYLPAPADEGRLPQPAIDVAPKAKKPKLNAAQMQGYEIDLSSDTPLRNMADDPERAQFIAKVREATKDDSLPNASKLKVFNDPPDYEGKPMLPGLLGGLPKPRQYFYEPSVSEFREVLSDSSLSRQLQREFSLVNDPTKMSDEEIQKSRTFAAYRDAAWKHALADAMRNGTPISRVEFSNKLGTVEKLQAKALDPVTSFNTGVLSGATMGASDPLIRSVAPETAEAERRSRLRSPNAALAGEIIGALNPRGAPSKLAAGTGRVLGKLGLKSTGLSGAAKGIAAGAATGAIDANARAIAQAASDALDAGESAVEAASRIYSTLKPDQMIDRTLSGAGLGAAMGAGGELLGAGAGKLARSVVGSDTNLPVLSKANASGVKMSGTGEPVLPADLNAEVNAARALRANADERIAERSVQPLANQRLAEQEKLVSNAVRDTETARGKLQGATVDMRGVADELKAMSDEMPGLTPEGAAKKTALRRFARKVLREGNITPERMDALIEEADAQANQGGKQPDPTWNRASAALRKGRDEFQYDEPTRADNYAIRDAEGNATNTSDYGGMKTKQSVERFQFEKENQTMGLPRTVESAPVRLGNSSDETAGRFLAEHPNYQQVVKLFNEDRAVASDLQRGDFSRPKDPNRTVGAMQATSAANKALNDTIRSGHGYQGVVYRGARLSPEEVQDIVSKGQVRADNIWSTSKSQDHALAFAKKGNSGEPVLMEIEGSSGVSLDAVPGLNTFDEVAVPAGKPFKITDSYRNKDGVLVLKMTDGTRGPTGDEALALAESSSPKAGLDFTQQATLKGKVLGAKDPANYESTRKLQQLAERAGIPENIRNIQRLHDAQNWKALLGKAIQGIGAGIKGNMGAKFSPEALALRAVPSLKSLSGGLEKTPRMEASPEAIDLVERFLEQAVPSWRGANLRGGQAARTSGAIGDRKKKAQVRDTMSDDEARFAANVIKKVLEMESVQ